MGNGYPAAAFGGRREIMELLPDRVSHGGTYAGNRVAAAAATKTLELIRDTDVLATVHATGQRLQDGLRAILQPTGLAYQFTGHLSMFGIMFTDKVATEYRDWANTDHELYDAIAVGMMAYGVMPEPDSREPWFVCEAHANGDHVDRALTAFEKSLRDALELRAKGQPLPHETAAAYGDPSKAGPDGAMSHAAGG
jgi:glutamate-1-semialdehyde 2,1-aminomutase